MIKKKADKLVTKVNKAQEDVEEIISTYLNKYADYGMDDIANELIAVKAGLEVVRLKLQYAMVKGDDNYE